MTTRQWGGVFRRGLLAVLAAVAAGLALPALGANHALILWIGDYGQPKLNLPGIDRDARNARTIALAMGVPEANIHEVSNGRLTRTGIVAELAALQQRIAPGDKVFVYYSGHGHQVRGVGGARCTEALVSRDPALYPDFELQEALTRLGNKASQVVMMNDSCFSGGAATKGLDPALAADARPKFFPEEIKGSSTITSGYECGTAVNKMARNLEPVAARTNVLYLAAASDTEVAYASPGGSVATQAWAACVSAGHADSNRSGAIDGSELQACAQRWINTNTPFRQTITLQGDGRLALSFVAAAAGVDPVQSLRDIAAGGAKDFLVSLATSHRNLRVRQDFLDLTVTTNRAGYLYLLQVGSDGRTFNLLFPNRFDQNNQIGAGTHSLPRPSWRVRAGGPPGTSHVLAVVTSTPRNLAKDMNLADAFPSGPATGPTFRTLMVEASGAAGGSGDYGASQVLSINELP